MPRGTIKKLRLFTYNFAYYGMGGQGNRIGVDGPWDVKRIVGTVPVEADGSVLFRARPIRPFRSNRWTPTARPFNGCEVG